MYENEMYYIIFIFMCITVRTNIICLFINSDTLLYKNTFKKYLSTCRVFNKLLKIVFKIFPKK